MFFLSQRLKEIKNNNDIFGGLSIILVRDTAQLPLVKGKCLQDIKSDKNDRAGYFLYLQFETVTILSKNERLDANDNDAIALNNFLLRLRDGNCTTED